MINRSVPYINQKNHSPTFCTIYTLSKGEGKGTRIKNKQDFWILLHPVNFSDTDQWHKDRKVFKKKKNKQIMFYASQQMQNIKKYMDSNLILITTKYS